VTGFFLSDKEDEVYRVPFGIVHYLFFRKGGLSVYLEGYGRICQERVSLPPRTEAVAP